ncbi:serine protease Do [Thiohalospira halophila DSM 15071]|uniref:Probable periplasmic serine endoprotease DegP-like n=2 Tax=Thiohalospira halophila TaxID=381300 RepID=A0A1I1NQX0_9GAMM|nr:DegQ family serine endoprotease [Thiohalospira halophila]SFC99692.1 serine protease Do [Thiohalospira halophila DSM 15071]
MSMNARILRVAALALVTLFLVGTAAARSGLPDFTELVKEQKDAVVNISTTQKVEGGIPGMPPGMELPEGGPWDDLFRRFFGENGAPRREFETTSLGSGFIISADGYVLTNHHVIAEAESIRVRMSDRSEYEAEVVGSDPRSDIALLKVDAEGLPTVEMDDSGTVEVGEWVMAIGTPFGFEHSVSVGVVSALGRSLPNDAYVPFIQTDVAINPGNSGGPLFNLDGEVIGINSQIYSRTGGYQGVSFAIPADVAMEVVRDLREDGRVTRGWLGVLVQDVDRELAESFGMEQAAGALVAQVVPEGPAAEAGLKPGDVITEFNGEPLPESGSLPPLVGRSAPDEEATLTVLRNGEEREIEVTLGELPEEKEMARAHGGGSGKPDSASKGADRLGLRVEPVPGQLRQRLEIEGGVVIADVERGPAARIGLRRGDVISMIAGERIRGVDHFHEVVTGLEAGRQVPVLVHRGQGPRFMALEVPEAE